MHDRLWSLRRSACRHALAWSFRATAALVLATAATEATAQGAGDRFNLLCEITILGSGPTTHEVRVYAIDLPGRSWSRAEPGAEVSQIKEVTDSTIVLRDSASADGQSRARLEIERYSGKLHGLVRSSPTQGQVEAGECTRQPFTGFPQKKI
jgi:hypothetical protein